MLGKFDFSFSPSKTAVSFICENVFDIHCMILVLSSALPRSFQDSRCHKRASSGSSITSNGPESPLDQVSIYQPRIATSDTHYSIPGFHTHYSVQPDWFQRALAF